jgi:hypothetical protein
MLWRHDGDWGVLNHWNVHVVGFGMFSVRVVLDLVDPGVKIPVKADLGLLALHTEIETSSFLVTFINI